MKNNFKFNYSVSVAEYDRNENEKDTYKLKWKEKEGTVQTLIDDIKNNMPLELLCSQMFYLDDSITFQNENNKEQQYDTINNINKNKTKENIVIFKFYKKETNDNSIKLKNEIN